MNRYVNEYSKAVRQGIENNLESLNNDVEELNEAYSDGNLELVDEQLQRIVKGASITIGLVTPVMLVEAEEIIGKFIEGGFEDERAY